MRLFSDFSKAIAFLLRNTRGVKHARVIMLLVIVTGILSGLSNTALIAVINTALNRGLALGGWLVWAFVGLGLLLVLSRFASSSLLAYMSSKATFELNMMLSRRVLAAPLRRLEELGAHRLLASITGDVAAISSILPILPAIIINGAIVVGCLAYLGWLSWQLLIGLLVIMAAGIFTYRIPLGQSMMVARIMRKQGDTLYQHYRAMVEGTKELKLHRGRGDAFYYRLFMPTAANMARLSFKTSMLQAVSVSWGTLLSFLPIALVIFLAPRVTSVSTEVLTGYTLIILYMSGPLQAIIGMLPTLTHASVAVDKIASLGLPQETAAGGPPQQAPQPAPAWDRLTLEGVTHTYYREKEDGSFTLGPIDLTLRPGELVYLIGGNGSGKTTLAKLISGLYAPESGGVRFNGRPVTDETREAYRQNFTVLFSDFFLFDSLLGFNPADLDERARRHLAELQLDHKVQVKDGKLSTTDLSQGQRKRLALLNAFLEDRPIYIFDEWASDQDPVFKGVFYHQILPELKARGKTVVVISHDDRYYDLGDRIVKLEYGKLVYDEATDRLPASASDGAPRLRGAGVEVSPAE
ncbi:MAG TPA: cyclic peptide export ABC transporter [Pyrinomonadaceae bacterium]|jgi:putative ATP-binding cassette transporter